MVLHPSLLPNGKKGQLLREELAEFKAKETDCGVCGVPAFCMVEVGCSGGYAVPRCEGHRQMPAYQAEARLHLLLSLTPPSKSGSDH
ncbi:MAG TPA: hypothetical protein VD761_11910 [Solirubrobacterales bacterium]|nr:hypothetical protein [Solirubrobacterales bacterium]